MEGGAAGTCSEGEPRRKGKAVQQPQQEETEGRGWMLAGKLRGLEGKVERRERGARGLARRLGYS